MTSACKFAHKFTKALDFGKYFQLPQDEKAISLTWAAFIERSDPSIFAQKCLQAVPIQAAGALGRPSCTVEDLDQLPRFPSSVKLFGGYLNHIHKMWADTQGHVEQYAYAGHSCAQGGAWDIRIVRHLCKLRGNYQDVPHDRKSYHYEKGCTDAEPHGWNSKKDGPWKPQWDCRWDFRAFSLSYLDDSITNVHHALEGIIIACFNMIDFDCPNRPRSNKTSAVIEEFASNMRQFVEQELGRPLPDFRTYGLNRASPFHETMTSIHKHDSRFLRCAINGCGKKHPSKLWLSVAGDLYSDRLCLFHFSQSQAFLSRGACVDCGLQRYCYPQTS